LGGLSIVIVNFPTMEHSPSKTDLADRTISRRDVKSNNIAPLVIINLCNLNINSGN